MSLLAALSGLILGSFFNVLIWRLPRGESIVAPPSHCTSCGRKIKPWENIPVISYILLGGKCAGCKERISIIYPLIELFTATASVALWFLFIKNTFTGTVSFSLSTGLLVQALFLLMMIPMSIIDIRHYIIPDLLSVTMIIAGLAVSFLPGGTTPIQSIIGIMGGGGILYLIGWLGTVIFKKGEAMGGGDIKLMAAAGALFGIEISLMGIIFGALLGSIAGIGMMCFKKLSADHRIPFGPYLGAGIWIAVLAGRTIVDAYLSFVDRIAVPF